MGHGGGCLSYFDVLKETMCSQGNSNARFGNSQLTVQRIAFLEYSPHGVNWGRVFARYLQKLASIVAAHKRYPLVTLTFRTISTISSSVRQRVANQGLSLCLIDEE